MSGFGQSFVTSDDLFIEETFKYSANDTFDNKLLEDHDVNIDDNPKLDLNDQQVVKRTDTIPNDWIIKESGYLVSPSGKSFQSRRSALTEMINSGPSTLPLCTVLNNMKYDPRLI